MYGTLFGVFALYGTSMTIIGATLPKILADFGWNYSTAGIVIGAGAVGYFCSAYAAGILVARIGPRATILIGLALEIAGLAFFASVPSPMVNFGLNLAVGLGQGCIELVVNWATLRLEKPGSTRAMNLMHGAFAVGALAGPFVIGLLMGASLSWTLVYRGISVLFVIISIGLFFLPFSALVVPSGTVEKQLGKSVSLYKHSAYWFGFIALFLYVGVELGVSNWVAEYFVTVFGASVSVGSFMVSLFWAGLLAGRFGMPLLYKGDRKDIVLVLMSILMSISVAALSVLGLSGIGAPAFYVAVVLTALAGLGCSVIYPIVVTFVGGAFPNAQSEAISFAATGGGIGAFTFPFIMSNIAQAWGIRAGFVAYTVFSFVVVAACTGLLWGSVRKE